MNWIWTDMDSFFASVEQHLRPELRGRPVGVVPVVAETTCVIAASYDAKRRGVRVGTGVREARRLCPDIALVKARPDVYVRIHHRILESVDRCVEVDRVYSIDEWAIRLRGEERHPERAAGLARAIKGRVLGDFGPWLTCSMGIAPTRLLAKIASDLRKPDGLTVLPVDEMPGRVAHLALEDLSGIGEGMLARLGLHGIRDVRGLWEVGRGQAVRIWGSVEGARWWAGFHGLDEPEVPTRRNSMSHGCVLAPCFRDEAGAHGILVRLVCKLGHRLRRGGYLARALRVSARDEWGDGFFGEIGLPTANDTPTLLDHFYRLWRRREPGARPIHKIEACVAGLVLESQVARPLFAEAERMRRLSRAIDAINARWGPSSVYFGPMHDYRHAMDHKIAFGRIPDGLD